MRLPNRVEKVLLKRSGFFSWGYYHWIHEDHLGDVWTTEEALELILEREI